MDINFSPEIERTFEFPQMLTQETIGSITSPEGQSDKHENGTAFGTQITNVHFVPKAAIKPAF